MRNIWRGLGLLFVLATGCSDGSTPLEPRVVVPPGPLFPPLTRPAQVFEGVRAADNPGYSLSFTRYVLYEDGTFAMQAGGTWRVERRGRYSGLETIIFDFDPASDHPWDVAYPGRAIGTLRGDSLTVRYDERMHWSDYVDGLYIRKRDM